MAKTLTDDTKALLQAFAYEGEVSGDQLSAMLGWTSDRIVAAIVPVADVPGLLV